MAEQAFERITRQLAKVDEDKAAAAAASAGGDEGKQKPEAAPAQPAVSAAVQAGIDAGNINIATARETMEVEETDEQRKNNELLAEFARRKDARALKVPIEDSKVRANLRALEEPITLFGEGPAERRDRLRELLSHMGATRLRRLDPDQAEDQDKQDEVWYHQGSGELQDARAWLADYSIPRARDRLKAARLKLANPDAEANSGRVQLLTQLQAYGIHSSEVGDTRPLTCCQFSPDGSMVATGSLSGLTKLWKVPNCSPVATLKGHAHHVGSVVWHPEATLSRDRKANNLATCGADGRVQLWSLDSETPMATLEGHDCRVTRIAYHPSGAFLGASCFDKSWRLWDLTKSKELLHQEGHSREVFGMAFHPDGSLAGTVSKDALGRIWDMRSGKNVLILQGHVKAVYAIDFSSNGYHVITGSEDHSIRLWDLRASQSVYTIPAHTGMISTVRYHPSGDYFVSCSQDRMAKIWSAPNCTPVCTLKGNQSVVTGVDVTTDSKWIVTSAHDRTLKLFSGSSFM